ncbi:MAG: aldehyde dehydrogenase family protein [Emcibacteraceae bacterium]|jgi:glyceraldehyde-3-phosphate dehydrogenase (NADP+)|nr:aldehyde dehydrogenase family protein [Emcibacteraceae bacterium]|tara:strand:+ start:4082 stop:5488 length:1407 start_codon:yes stop_codon:yes gene_type:complete
MLMYGKTLATEKQIAVKNPYTGEIIEYVSHATKEDVVAAGKMAEQGWLKTRQLSRFQRSTILLKAASIVKDRRIDFAKLIVTEAGKTITQAYKEVDRCINTLTLSAEEAKRHNGETIPFDSYEGSENRQGYFTKEPLGIIAAITPFNDPLNLVAHKIGPAMACGNSILLKPSELAPLSAIKLCKVMLESGYPQDALGVLTGDAETGSALVSLPKVRMVSFTGGVTTGEAIIKTAGLKKYAMDLGGNAPVIVLADCDMALAVEACVSGSFWAAGQNCIGSQRLLIEKGLYDDFKDEFIKQTKEMVVGDPMNEATDMGPMISEDAAIRAQSWANEAVTEGANLLYGNERDKSLYGPTVLDNVTLNSKVLCNEVFAPIVNLVPVENMNEAIEIANRPEYSLHAGIFTKDLERALSAADQLEASGIMINDSSDYRFDAMPFGGYKYGGLGREGVRFSMDEMSQTKVICFNRG